MIDNELEIYKVDEIYRDPKKFLKLVRIFMQNNKQNLSDEKILYQLFGDKDQNVLIVGNGPSALENELGHAIDEKMNVVVRINNYEKKGYEKYIGSETHIWANCVGEKTIPRKVAKHINILTFIGRRNFSPYYAKREINAKIQNFLEVDKIYHTHEIQYIFERYYNFTNKLTTGLMCIILLSTYYNKPIYCIGFDFYSYSKNYYYNSNMPLSRKHNLNYEKKMFKYLERKGIIKILTFEEISNIDQSLKLKIL
jgi:hypothetical protein